MSIAAWCDLKSKGDTLKSQDVCHKTRCKCLKQVTFTPRQRQLDGEEFRKTMKKVFKGTEKMWNNFITWIENGQFDHFSLCCSED